MDPRDLEGWAYDPGSAWCNPLFKDGVTFIDPPPDITPEGRCHVPATAPACLLAHLVPVHGHR